LQGTHDWNKEKMKVVISAYLPILGNSDNRIG
jgi:hypothetical protein